MSFTKEFSSFLDQLKPYLIDYLQEKGIDTDKNFCCLNPDHDDHNPSMTAIKAEECGHSVFCFSCQAKLDLFDIYAIFENKPRTGPIWMKEVVLPLAEKYGVKPPVYELSQNDQFCYDLYRVYEEVASMINHQMEAMKEDPAAYIKEKEWNTQTLEKLDIGTLSYSKLQDKFERETLERFGLNRPDVFDENNVIFAVRDEHGRVIRFFCRMMNDAKRWQSTGSGKLLVDIWSHKGRLYLSHLLDKKKGYAILVEGHPDAVTLHQYGFENVIAACGTAGFSEAHATRLAFNAISEIIVIYDNDEAGKKAINKLLSQEFVRKSGAKYSIVNLIDAKDPDEYLRKNGKENLEHLIDIRLSAFRYLLSQFDTDTDIDKITEVILPYIAANKSDIAREAMAREFAKYFGDDISISAILEDVKKLDDEVRNKIESRQKLVINAATTEAKKNPEQSIEIFREATDRLEDIEKEVGGTQSIEGATVSRIQLCKQWEEMDRSHIPNAFKLIQNRMGNFQDMLSTSSWASGQLFFVGAVENMGKSSWVNDLAWQIASIKSNQARVFMHTIDDSAEDLIRRMVCQAYGDPDLTMNMIANPQTFYEDEGISNVYEMREEAYAKFMEVAADGRLFIKDASDGTSIAFAEAQIKHIRRKYPDDNLVYFLDNFHNITDWPTLDPRQRFTNASKYLKRLATIYRCTIVSTVEYRKNDPTKPGTNEDLAECITDDMEIIDYDTGVPTRIADIKIGTRVHSLDTRLSDERIQPQRVVNKFDKGTQECFRIALKNGEFIEATANHPIYTRVHSYYRRYDWVEVEDLREQDYIAIKKNNKIEPAKIKSITPVGKKHVWDIEVENNHNFIANGIVCHNCRGLKFDARLILHIFSDAHSKGVNNASLVHKYKGQFMPRILARVGKSKVGSFKGDLYFDFFPASGIFKAVEPTIAELEIKQRVEYLQNEGNSDEEGEESSPNHAKKFSNFCNSF